MRKLGSLVVLTTLLVGTPIVLLSLGYYTWDRLNVWTPADFRVVLVLLTLAGWASWAMFALSALLECVRIGTGGRIAIRLPGLALPQTLAGTLLTAILVSTAGPAGTSVAAGPAITSTPVAGSAAAESHAAVRATAPAASPAPARAVALHHAAEATRDAHTVVHVVASGDDLWSLAERYYGAGGSWRQIVAANPDLLAADPTADLVDGIALAIVNPTAVSLAAQTPAPTEAYTIEKGDTLWHLAEERLGDGRRYPELQRLNADQISDPDHIETGWVIALPEAPDAAPPPAPAPALAPEPEATPAPAASTPTPAPTPAPTSTPTPSAQPTTQPETAASTPAPAAAPDAPNVFDSVALRATLGGLAALAASGVLGSVLARRRERAASRELGRTFPAPEAELRRFETALGLADAPDQADDTLPPDRLRDAVRRDDLDRVELVAKAMRKLAGSWWQARVRPPRLRRALLGGELLEFQFEEDPPALAAPFEVDADARVARVPWQALRLAAASDHGVAYPGLVTLGQDESGRLVMVDVVTWGVLAVDGDRPGLPDVSLSAMIVEFSCSPWAGELSLRVITRDPAFVDAAALEQVRRLPDAAAGVADLERRFRERHALLTLAERGYDSLRLDPDRADAWAPIVYVFEEAPDAAQLARIRLAVDGDRLGLAAVLPLTDATAASDPAPAPERPRLHLTRSAPSAAPLGVLEPTGIAVSAQTIEPEARDSIVRLFADARSSATAPAFWWHDNALVAASPVTASEPAVGLDAAADRSADDPVATTLQRRMLRAVAGPRLRLFGDVRLEGAAGQPPAKAERRCLEYCGWLLTHPGATASEMTAALFVTDGTRRSNLSRLRSWLGGSPEGEPYLPEAYSGRIALHPDVSSDWAELRRLVAAGVDQTPPGRLRAALALVDGAPLADAAPGEWAWADGLRGEMAELVRDAAVVLARAERARGDLDAAGWACARGRLVAPDDELLGRELMLIADAAGRPDEVSAVLKRLDRAAASRGVDLDPETVELGQLLLEGAPRV
ncbi:MAG TPA: LysM peptidoglycan-binding domain-containing protein, partial [Polyangiaceae bacterium]|nr:LysM peptidoglycan-binding domain-containing protein [Polyangiaceae bacterium]